jgi:hypothetical protein
MKTTLVPSTHQSLRESARLFHPDWTPNDWFRWPPDLFALTSWILRTTGVYRCAAVPPEGWKEDARRSVIDGDNVERIRQEWRAWIVGRPRRRRLPPELRQLRDVLFDPAATLRQGDGSFEPTVCQALLTAHALADEVCASLGLQWGPQAHAELGFAANFHLAVTGSLSLCPRDRGVVLPKMRTPQSGLTIRSLSHHLSFHVSEAVVHWWTVPWFDREADQNGINVLAVPLPYQVEAAAFQPSPEGGTLSDGRRFGYFRYLPREAENTSDAEAKERATVEEILALVRAAYRDEVKHLHLLVLPEVALTQGELKLLRSQLVAELLGMQNIPMVVTGVRHSGDGREMNQVVISAFYADRWYELRQHKHHRWKLTRSQLKQYALGGHLNVQQDWWEAMDVPPRTLTFLTPTGWLSLCPLICEDLAQLEPLSELIRGVGPTLVTALLLDGPQLAHRWPARYAGVLADDPGSSVLTVTALGMARRCHHRGHDVDTTAVSWKDTETGWESVKLDGDNGVLLSLKAEWTEEFTADGRSDHGASAHMVLQSVRSVKRQPVPSGAIAATRSSGPPREAVDVLELTIFCYLVDAVLDVVSPERTAQLFSIARLQEPGPDLLRRFPLVRRIQASVREHLQQGRAPGESGWPSPEFDEALCLVEGFLAVVNEHYPHGPVELLPRWSVLTEVADKMLRHSVRSGRRAEKLAYFTVLWAIHSRLMDRKRWLGKQPQSQLNTKDYNEVRDWLRQIEHLVAEFSTDDKWAEN